MNPIKEIINWINHHGILTFFIVLFLILFAPSLFSLSFLRPSLITSSKSSAPGGYLATDSVSESMMGIEQGSYGSRGVAVPSQVAPNPDVADRKVITNSYLNLVVKNVSETIQNIKQQVKTVNGYVVNSYVNKDESAESGNITLRVPNSELESFLDMLRKSSIKVTDENLSGSDITDEYIDIEYRIKTAEGVLAKLEEIQQSAVKVEDMISIQNQIFNQMNTIERYKGQLKYMDGASSTTLIAVNLSTDEFSLPYNEPLSWRPEVIYKHSVRQLIGLLQGIGSFAIWAAVMSVIWVPALIIFRWIVKKLNKNSGN